MTALDTIKQTISPDIERLNERITATLSSPNELMNTIVGRYLERRGKQIRPVLVMLCANMLQGRVNNSVLAGAVAVELLHNASLIHDDVVDDTTTRRGSKTINGMWDSHMAVLVGDFFLSNALMQGVESGNLAIIRSISDLGRQLAIGELDEMHTASHNILSEEAYFNIIYRKTASLFVACTEVAAYGCRANEAQAEALRRFGRLLGLCFQIKDDVFDYFPNPELGKPTGNDIREGKVTLPLLYALTQTTHPRRDDMLALATRTEPLTNEEIALLADFAVEAGGIDYAEATMRRLRNEAAEALAIFPDSPWRDSLLRLLDFIIARGM